MGEADYSKLSEAELDALFSSEQEAPPVAAPEPLPPVPEPSPEPEAPPAEEPPAEEPVAAETPVEPEPTQDADAELAAMDVERERLRREKLEADLELQKAHSSRLAGEIGFLKEKLKTVPTRSEPYEPQSEAELDRLAVLENNFAQEKQRRIEAEVSQAVESAINGLDGAWAKDLAKEISEVAPKYADQIKAARETQDPALARQIATAVVLTVKAEAGELAWSNRRKSLEEKRTVQLAQLDARKKAAAVSGGGTTAASRPKPKTYDQMTAAELDTEMEKEFGRR